MKAWDVLNGRSATWGSISLVDSRYGMQLVKIQNMPTFRDLNTLNKIKYRGKKG